MRDALWYAPISLVLAAFAGAGLVAALLVVDRRYYDPRDVAIVAGVAAVALVAELGAAGALAAWIARVPRPAAGDVVLAETYGGIATHALVVFIGAFCAMAPGFLAAGYLRGEVRVTGALLGLGAAAGLAGIGLWFATAGRMVWIARAESRVVERRGVFEEARIPLADVVGVEVQRWAMSGRLYQDAFLRLRDGVQPATIPLGTPASYAAVTREADRVAAAAELPRLPDVDRRVAPAR